MKRRLSSVLLKLILVATVALVGLYLARDKIVCRWTPKQAREATLKKELFTIRQAIDNYTLDKQRPPQSLQDLVVEHYIPELPTDPFTCRKDWVAQFGDVGTPPGSEGLWGLYDISSNSGQTDSNGMAYNAW